MQCCRYVMVANAHQNPGSEEMRTLNNGYLAVVTGVLLSWNSILVVKFLTAEDSDLPDWCSGLQNESNQQFLLMVPTAFCVLCLVFIALLTLKTNAILDKMQHQHLQHLPAKNALTFLDTQILLVSIIVQFFIIIFISILFYFLYISHDTFIILKATFHLFLDNLCICSIFPVYIILKTKKYFPRLWDDNSPMLKQNNDFFMENPSQVSPQP